MRERIKLVSVQDETIVFEKPRKSIINNVFLLNEKKNKVDIEIISQIDNLILKNPVENLEEGINYFLWINNHQKASEESLLTGMNGISIEGDTNAIVFRKHSGDLFPSNSEHILEGDMPTQIVDFEENNSSLNIFNQILTKMNVKSFFAVNEETEEKKEFPFSFAEDTVSIDLSESLPRGHWQLKVLYTFNSLYLIDTIVEGDPAHYNKSSFIGYIGKHGENHQGIYFKGNRLVISSLLVEDFFKEIPVDEREDILVDQVIVHDTAKRGIELHIVDEQFLLSKLKEIIFVSRKRKKRVRITTVKLMNGNIFVPLTSETLQEVSNNRWDLEGWFVNGKQSRAGRLQVVRATNKKLTYLNFSTDDYTTMVYTTMNNYIAILKSSGSFIFKERYKIKTKMLNIVKKDKDGFSMTVQVKKVGNVTIKNILLKLRSHDTIKMIETGDTEVKHIQNHSYSAHGSFSMDWGKKFFPLYWDIFITVVDEEGNEERIKVTDATSKLKKQVNKDYFKNAIYTKDKILYPYVTLKNDIAFMMRDREYYENKKNKLKEKLAYVIYLAMKPFYYRNKDIWLGFEKFSATAQDNGYAFFQYVDKNKLHDNFYFILDKHSSDYEEVRKQSNKVVPFMSFKYLLLIYASNLLVSSENKRHVYNLRIKSGIVPKKIASKQSVFLQHGVTALKQSNVFKKAKGRGNFSLVIATSELEEEIINQNWKYELNEIAVTGFSRWDKLFDKSQDRKHKKIFVMPTWRTWMEDMPKEDFKRTDYYDNYINFLNSKDLEVTLKKHDLQLVFFLHPKFKQYISEFKLDSEHISLKEFQNIKVNEEIMEASLMISDYSSVTWDMFFMKKPVLFYQFDYEKYERYEGSYIDMATQLFGERALNKQELIQLVQEYAENGFQLKPRYEKLHGEYFKYVDHNNSQRIFDVIKNLK
ncbi:CDP-glycerol glycerophosphotransferase family protein [Tetragenococcus koreensis]|uniref:CDP-glycerol glycerophosphotransferase family protein n=1 Tax=Tetragenococcus koreensis TaxID=290335 RepID=UPI001F39E9B3|nr:CDP-glycerol glycerophosphotransferase family protein [Tetragenococcus koreensis]MDN6570409.1 CDP-glycerol glycerophosphotransferase family protein [Staphylococcus equorum]MDN6640908.1 CDP-glycerol glycerophosphotransferase family protein [Tetragenococcus sp.]MCF1622055.1 CDP-glycerol glycerophosphotransferase family protein [Tetragenococcus koreensis]MCF1626849.1 CDP-glycerol glycerophosphotransferase family protein [Tetragenococcus koreensis]MCF1632796.1 CDP-glycerol glycerophosphotransfe